VGLVINAQQKLESFYDVHLYVLNSSWEKREGEGKQHLHQIMGKVEDRIWEGGE